MATIIVATDFTGFHRVSQDTGDKSVLNQYIVKFQKKYLQLLFGNDLYSAFVLQLSGDPLVPSEARFILLFSDYDFKDMLIGFLYFEYVRNQADQNTNTGTVRNLNENSNITADAQIRELVEQRYNDAVALFNKIRKLLVDDHNLAEADRVYPEFAPEYLSTKRCTCNDDGYGRSFGGMRMIKLVDSVCGCNSYYMARTNWGGAF